MNTHHSASLLLFYLSLLFLSACTSPEPAEYIELPELFSDHMVLQRDAMVTVWGKATPGHQVTVTLNNQRSVAKAQPDSSWRLYLAPEEAGGPYTLRVIGADTLAINNVLVGEVWIASGQSNMQWPVSQANNAEFEIQAANYPNIRLFTVDRVVSLQQEYQIPSSGWQQTTPESVASFSAVAYYFGRTLFDSLQVPIGLIHSSWGGTPAEAWTSAETLKDLPDFSEEISRLPEDKEGLDAINADFPSRLDSWLETTFSSDPGYDGETPVWASTDHDHLSWPTMDIPEPWETMEPQYNGIMWFRKTIDLPDSWIGSDATLFLSTVDDVDVTWINGVEIGRTYQYNQERSYHVPASTLRKGNNIITVRILDTGGDGGLRGDPEALKLTSSDDALANISLTGAWHYQPTVPAEQFASPPPRPRPLQHTPTVLYNAMIHPLVPYRVRGFIWYQGESNAGRAFQYRTLFPALITDWRMKWNANSAFHFVQLANFMEPQQNPVEEETWPELREAQKEVLAIPNTGMAVTIDIGEADDIHPRNKQDVGYRLALSALHVNYNRPSPPAGPLYKSMSLSADTVLIEFDNADSGLKTKRNEPLQGFAIAGKDQVFYQAEGAIQGNKVVLWSDQVQQPAAVRYGWANNPRVNLYNLEGLPASPFKTDDWPWITENN